MSRSLDSGEKLVTGCTLWMIVIAGVVAGAVTAIVLSTT
jgi:hypothetical protein